MWQSDLFNHQHQILVVQLVVSRTPDLRFRGSKPTLPCYFSHHFTSDLETFTKLSAISCNKVSFFANTCYLRILVCFFYCTVWRIKTSPYGRGITTFSICFSSWSYQSGLWWKHLVMKVSFIAMLYVYTC